MGNLTVKEIESKAKGEPGRYADGAGLYFVVPKLGVPYWMLRYTAQSKRKEMTLAKYSDMSLADARAEAATKMQQFRDGLDPLVAKKRAEQSQIKTVDDLFADWHLGNVKRLKHHEIPERIYRKDIAPYIGSFNVDSVTARDIKAVLQAIAATNRPAIANDALMYCKQLFNHGIKLDLLGANPASAFSISDAGGLEKSKDRALTLEEVTTFFKIARENSDSFSRDNYLACALLITLGVRKSELAEAPWKEFNLDEKVWNLSKDRSKSGVGIAIP